jgi:hypothetical protein
MNLNNHVSSPLCLMQHYDRRGQYDIALNKIDEAISHTPTVIDLYSVKVSHSHLPTPACALTHVLFRRSFVAYLFTMKLMSPVNLSDILFIYM